MKIDPRFERSCKSDRIRRERAKADLAEKNQIVEELGEIVRRVSIKKARALLGVARVGEK
jgi:hypothetical protein